MIGIPGCCISCKFSSWERKWSHGRCWGLWQREYQLMSWYQKNVSFESYFNKQKNLRDWPCVILAQFTWNRGVPKLSSRLIDAEVLELANSLLFLSGWRSNSSFTHMFLVYGWCWGPGLAVGNLARCPLWSERFIFWTAMYWMENIKTISMWRGWPLPTPWHYLGNGAGDPLAIVLQRFFPTFWRKHETPRTQAAGSWWDAETFIREVLQLLHNIVRHLGRRSSSTDLR